jgi:hypothetical protein
MGAGNKSQQQGSEATILYKGTTLFHFLKHSEGKIRIIPVSSRMASNSLSYKLFDSQGSLIQQKTLTRPTNVKLPSTLSGIASLMTDSGEGLLQVQFPKWPFVIEASGTFPMITRNLSHTFEVLASPEQNQLKFRAYYPGSKEASITFQSPDTGVRETVRLKEFTESHISIHNSPSPRNFRTVIFEVKSTPEIGDLWFYFYDEQFPYVFP